jgi:hypothetical protein
VPDESRTVQVRGDRPAEPRGGRKEGCAVNTTTAYHFGRCQTLSTHRKSPTSNYVEIHFECWGTSDQGDQVTLHLDGLSAQQLCKVLLNIIGNDSSFHKELEQQMKIQRSPE